MKKNFVFTVLFLFLLAGVERLVRCYPADTEDGEVFRSPARKKAEWVSWGNSHGYCDLNFSASGVPYYHYGLGGEDLIETLHLSSVRLKSTPHVKIIFLPISYFLFHVDNSSACPDVREFAYSVGMGMTKFPQDVPAFLKGRAQAVLLRFGVTRTDALNPKFFRQFYHFSRDQYGFRANPSTMSATELDTYCVESDRGIDYHLGMMSPAPLETCTDALVGIVRLLEKKNIRLICFTPPYWRKYLELFPVSYRQEMSQQMSLMEDRYGCEYYDFSQDPDMINNASYFRDDDHLSKEGSIVFTEKLLKSSGLSATQTGR